MVALNVLFWSYVVLFAVIGAARGWAKELLVTASIILSLFIITLMETYFDPIRELTGANYFWVRAVVVAILVFFGYETPSLRALAGPRFARERFQDVLLGMVLGAVNGYMVFGTLWYYMHDAGYPFPYFTRPGEGTPLAGAALEEFISRLPPALLDPPWIYFATALAFLFIVVVFI